MQVLKDTIQKHLTKRFTEIDSPEGRIGRELTKIQEILDRFIQSQTLPNSGILTPEAAKRLDQDYQGKHVVVYVTNHWGGRAFMCIWDSHAQTHQCHWVDTIDKTNQAVIAAMPCFEVYEVLHDMG